MIYFIKTVPRELSRSVFLAVFLFSGLTGQTSFSGLDGSYHVRSLGLAGGGSVITSPESDHLNPAAGLTGNRNANFSWVSYPAGINGGFAAVNLPVYRHALTISLRQLNYGSFDGYSVDAVPEASYNAGDTWFSISVLRHRSNRPLSYGLTAGIFHSQLADHDATVVLITPGLLWNIPEYQLKTGLSLVNSGIILNNFTSAREKLPARLVAGFSRRLTHLPLELAVDYGYLINSRESTLHVGGIFHLSAGIKLRWGTSSDKIEQAPGNQDARDLFAASGISLSYAVRDLNVDFGGYYYGPGFWVYGIGMGVAF